MGKSYKIFGAGPGGLYTAWRLITGGTLQAGDSVELVEWGNYDFEGNGNGSRSPAGRICSYHYQKDTSQSYVEIGGMRYVEWDGKSGHQLVTKTINKLGLDDKVIEFNTTDNPLFYLRGEHFYQDQLGNGVTAPYNTPGNNEKPADDLFSNISGLMIGNQDLSTRSSQCGFYQSGTLPANFNSFVYNPGDPVKNIGYWNVFYDQAGNEGYCYAADAGGYSSNVINWNAADAAIYNGEFAPGGSFKTLSTGYSSLFSTLYTKSIDAAQNAGITFSLTSNTRLHSIWYENNVIKYKTANADAPDTPASDPLTADYAFLAMPPHSIELVARATRYQSISGQTDFLNATNVQNYLASVIEQPSYKVAMFFDSEWWKDSTYPPKLVNQSHDNVNVYGPTITDIPLRQIYYFGNNAPGQTSQPVYGILASYDDMRFTKFWRAMEIDVNEEQTIPPNQNYQPLDGAGTATYQMQRMLLLELAKVHYGSPDAAGQIPTPKETVFMDWGYNPFGAGYHAWAAHYNIGDVMQNLRAPARMAGVTSGNVFIVGSAFSNDQAWVEGAFCTAESVLSDFLDIPTIAETENYPLICGSCS